MRAGLLLLLLSGCIHRIPPANCVTTLASILVRGTNDCAGADAAEARTLQAFARNVAGDSVEQTSKVLYHWTLSIGEPLSSVHTQAQETICDLRCIFLPSADWTRVAFPHEVGHALENCAEMSPEGLDHEDPRDNQKHPNWGSRGVWKSIDQAAGP